MHNKYLQTTPLTFILDGQAIQQARQKIIGKTDIFANDLVVLRETAETALQEKPFFITSKTTLPISGNPHDYFSQGPYWWPNPATFDGLPYVRRDGETNPDSCAIGCDQRLLNDMTFAVITLVQAWYLTENSAYAQYAAILLRTWFLDTETRMNPHLQYAQSIPGVTDGRGIGIIDTAIWVRFMDALVLLKTSSYWLEKDHRNMQEWFSDYLHWMKTSKNGQEEQQEFNNHGTWFDAQVVAFALFTEQKEIAQEQIEDFTRSRIASQIAADGSQPHELKRTQSWTYSLYNLHGFMSIARMGEHVGIDLWNSHSNGGGSICKAVEFLLPYAGSIEKWPYPQFKKSAWKSLQSRWLLCTFLVFGELSLLQPIHDFHQDINSKDSLESSPTLYVTISCDCLKYEIPC